MILLFQDIMQICIWKESVVAAAATDYTCSVVCQLRVTHTPAASQNLCENFHNRGGPPSTTQL